VSWASTPKEGQLERHHDPSQIQQAKKDGDAFPAKITAGDYHGDQPDRRKRYAEIRRHTHMADRQSDGSELGNQRQEIHRLKIKERERSPPLAKALVDHGRVAFASCNAKPDDHLLDEIRYRQQEQDQPEEPGSVLGARLNVGRYCASVVVCLHDDKSGPEDHQESKNAVGPPGAHNLSTDRRHFGIGACDRNSPQFGLHLSTPFRWQAKPAKMPVMHSRPDLAVDVQTNGDHMHDRAGLAVMLSKFALGVRTCALRHPPRSLVLQLSGRRSRGEAIGRIALIGTPDRSFYTGVPPRLLGGSGPNAAFIHPF
jgi:hypothetical protein